MPLYRQLFPLAHPGARIEGPPLLYCYSSVFNGTVSRGGYAVCCDRSESCRTACHHRTSKVAIRIGSKDSTEVRQEARNRSQTRGHKEARQRAQQLAAAPAAAAVCRVVHRAGFGRLGHEKRTTSDDLRATYETGRARINICFESMHATIVTVRLRKGMGIDRSIACCSYRPTEHCLWADGSLLLFCSCSSISGGNICKS